MVLRWLLLFFGNLFYGASGAMCNNVAKPGPPNMEPISIGAPRLVRTCSHGKLFAAGDGEDAVDLVHVYGRPYDWGFAQGTLLKGKLLEFFPRVYKYFEEQVFAKAANSTLLAWVAKVGLDVALDLSYEVTKKDTPAYMLEEVRGLVAALDEPSITVDDVRRVQWIGELTRGSCSMFGAWGDATASRGGKLLQLRALDWDTEGPFKSFPAVVVYHPSDPADGHAWVNVGFTGWISSITGMSSAGLSISEIGVSYPDATFGNETYLMPGYPWGFLLRDILQRDTTLEAGVRRITSAQRTADLLLGVGDGNAHGGQGAFRGIQYSPGPARVFTDDDLEPSQYDWHPRIKHIVYWGMDWICPNDNRMLSHQLRKWYGNLTAYNTIRYILPYVQTGSLHVAIYDHALQKIHISTAR